MVVLGSCLVALSSFAIISLEKSELVALLWSVIMLSYGCLCAVSLSRGAMDLSSGIFGNTCLNFLPTFRKKDSFIIF